MIHPRRFVIFAGLAAFLAFGPALAQEVDRYASRFDVEIPEGAIVSTLDDPEFETLQFSPVVDDIVTRLDLETFDGYLRGLSGAAPVTITGSPHTFTTRFSLSTGGGLAWVYAYEQFEALGFDVRYHEYTRNGNNLKNIIATIPGETTPERIYVIGGHIDSTSPDPYNLAPGAEDNGSGSAAVLAAAAALAGERFESTIELVLFSGEEQGLWGSQAYVSDAIAEGRDIRSAVTMDMVAYFHNDYGVLIEGDEPWAGLMQSMADAVDRYTSIERDFSYFSFGSDHVPFQNAGIPAILAIDLDWGEYPYYHQTTDTYDRTTPELGLEIAHASLATIAQMAGPLGPLTSAGSGPLALQSFYAFPNPARSSVEIRMADGVSAHRLDHPAITIFDATGRNVRTFSLSASISRTAPLLWDLTDDTGARVQSGLYWIRLAGDVSKVTVVR